MTESTIDEILSAFTNRNIGQNPLNAVLTDRLPNGFILEFGVWSGQTINTIADALPDRTIYGLDSFEGLPETWRAGFSKGVFGRDTLPAVRDNVVLIKGWFDQTLPQFKKDVLGTNPIALIHLDADLYSSTRTALTELKDNIKSGTVLVFDELFNYPGYREHEIKALAEFLQDSHFSFEVIGCYTDNPRQSDSINRELPAEEQRAALRIT